MFGLPHNCHLPSSAQSHSPSTRRAPERLCGLATPYAVAAYEKSSEFGAMCLEKAGPYAQEAVAKTKEFGAMCVEKAGPYMDKATEAAKPYVEAVKAKFS